VYVDVCEGEEASTGLQSVVVVDLFWFLFSSSEIFTQNSKKNFFLILFKCAVWMMLMLLFVDDAAA